VKAIGTSLPANGVLEECMSPEKRSVEPSDERKQRLDENARKQNANAIENEAVIDEMIRRNIEKHGV
jgi:hypothetical protein